MKRILTLIGLLFALNLSAQTFQVATKIEATSDCKLRFLNKIDSQIYEINSNDMVWFYISGSSIKIKDYDNEVTIFKTNITYPTFANLPYFLDSVQSSCQGGGSIAGVESVNGKDGDLKIVAGSNVTIDNSKSDTIVINATGGEGSVTASNGLQIMGDSSIGLGGVIDEITDIIVMPYSSLNIYDEDNIIGLSHTGSSVEMRGDNAMLAMGDDIALSAPKSTLASSDYVVMVDSMGGGSNRQLRLVPKSDFSGDGNYLPLDIQDSTTVELNGNSVMFKGDNHSLVMNTPFEAYAIGGAVMDGFRAQQYDDILTMNGVMKVPVFFGDTIRYPVMFLSHGMPFSDTARIALLRGSLGEEFGFFISTTDEVAEEITDYEFLNDKFSITKNTQSVFEIDLTTGIIDAPYVSNKDSTNIAQVQDIIDLTSPNIVTVDTIQYYIMDGVSYIVTLADGSEFVHLPFVSNAIGKSIHIINNSSNAVDISSASLNEIWQNGALVTTVTLPSGSTMMLINNGSSWVIF